MKYILHKQNKRGSFYELLLSVFDDTNNLVLGNISAVAGSTKLTTPEVDNFVITNIYPQLVLVSVEPERVYTESEITKTLQDKGYMVDSLNALPVKIIAVIK